MSERYIKIVQRCERRRTGWTLAFHLCLIDARLVRILSQFCAANSRLIFTTRAAAERQARDWRKRNFPDWLVRSSV